MHKVWNIYIFRGGSRLPRRRGRQPYRAGANIWFCQILWKSAWIEKFLAVGGLAPGAPPLNPPLIFVLPKLKKLYLYRKISHFNYNPKQRPMSIFALKLIRLFTVSVIITYNYITSVVYYGKTRLDVVSYIIWGVESYYWDNLPDTRMIITVIKISWLDLVSCVLDVFHRNVSKTHIHKISFYKLRAPVCFIKPVVLLDMW